MADEQEPTAAAEGTTYELNGEAWTVGPKCEEAVSGNWVCTTHGATFSNQMSKDSHIGTPGNVCVLAWNCHAHGPEVP
jgi:hypothetical protein